MLAFPRAGYGRGVAVRTLFAVGLAVVAIGALATSGSAHARLTGASPADGSIVARVPSSVRLTFSDLLQERLVRVRVTRPDGVQTDQASVSGTSVSVDVPDGGAGRYAIAYRVVSSDGHPVSGSMTFTVAPPARTPQPARPTPTTAAASTTTATTGGDPADGSTASAPGGTPSGTATGTSASSTQAATAAGTTVAAAGPVTSQPSSDGGAPVAAILVVAVAVLALAGAAYAAARRRTG